MANRNLCPRYNTLLVSFIRRDTLLILRLKNRSPGPFLRNPSIFYISSNISLPSNSLAGIFQQIFKSSSFNPTYTYTDSDLSYVDSVILYLIFSLVMGRGVDLWPIVYTSFLDFCWRFWKFELTVTLLVVVFRLFLNVRPVLDQTNGPFCFRVVRGVLLGYSEL